MQNVHADETSAQGESIYTGSSVTDASKRAQSENKLGQITSLVQAGLHGSYSYKHFSKCASCSTPSCPWECAIGAMHASLGALAVAQAKQHSNSASQAGNSSCLTSAAGCSPGLDIPDNSDLNIPPALANNPDVRAGLDILRDMEKDGVLKNGTVKTNGKTYTPKDFASKENMQAAGIPSDAASKALSEAMAISKQAEEKAKKVKLGGLTEEQGYAEGGGAFSNSAASGETSTGVYGMGGETSRKGLGLDRDPAQVAGMQKNYHGEPIGVAGDSIFKMMNRRYQVKDKQDAFFGEMDLAIQK